MPINALVSSINPFSGYIAQGTQVERTQANEKTRQVRRTQALSKDVAARDDELEHQVESSDAPSQLKDDDAGSGQQQHHYPREEDDDKLHLDITA